MAPERLQGDDIVRRRLLVGRRACSSAPRQDAVPRRQVVHRPGGHDHSGAAPQPPDAGLAVGSSPTSPQEGGGRARVGAHAAPGRVDAPAPPRGRRPRRVPRVNSGPGSFFSNSPSARLGSASAAQFVQPAHVVGTRMRRSGGRSGSGSGRHRAGAAARAQATASSPIMCAAVPRSWPKTSRAVQNRRRERRRADPRNHGAIEQI